MKEENPKEADVYRPDMRLREVYSEANSLDGEGLETLCPSYSELAKDVERYVDETLMGEGALKEVTRAFDRRTQRWVAMARLRSDREEDFYDLFVQEAWLVASLSHPNIIKVHDSGIAEDGRPFFTMDLKSKSTLRDLVMSDPKPDLRDLLQVFMKVCDAISYAHSKNIVHLDLKPENIQSDAFGEVVVCDWGLGKVCEGEAFEEDVTNRQLRTIDGMTLMGQIKGSLGYMAPEQAVVGERKNFRTDIFALGCILHFILIGEPPFKGSRDEVLNQMKEPRRGSLRERYPDLDIPESLDAVVMKATSIDPEARYRSVPRLQMEIERYLSGYATRAENPGFLKEARLFVSRNRIEASITAIGLFVLGVVSVFFAHHLGREKLATEVERERADQLLVEVDALDSEYTTFVERSEASRKELARALARSARGVRDLSIYERPLETFVRSRNIANMALEQDPLCREAHLQHFALDCLQLNYASALTRPMIEDEGFYYNYLVLAENFPEFDFDRNRRPSVDQLVDCFRRARVLDDDLHGHLERVLAYDSAAREDRGGYERVVEAFLQYRHGGAEKLSLVFDEESLALSLWSSGDVSLLGQEFHWKSLLRFLSYRILSLDIGGRFQLADLDRQPVEILDVSACRNAVIGKEMSLPQLKTIIVRAGQFGDAELRSSISSHAAFEIIEVAR